MSSANELMQELMLLNSRDDEANRQRLSMLYDGILPSEEYIRRANEFNTQQQKQLDASRRADQEYLFGKAVDYQRQMQDMGLERIGYEKRLGDEDTFMEIALKGQQDPWAKQNDMRNGMTGMVRNFRAL